MNLQAKKMGLVEQLMQINDDRILTAVQSILSFGLDKKEDEPILKNHFTSAQKEQIEIALKQLKEGKKFSNEDVMAEFRAKYQKV